MVDILNWVASLFTSILDVITAVVLFIIHGFQSILYIISQIPLYLQYVASCLAVLPAWLLPFVFTSLYLAVFKWIVEKLK